MPSELYRNTAGEIEARDAAGRREMPADERRFRMPTLGDENTVFAEEIDISRHAIGRTTSNKPFVEVTTDILAGVPERDWVRTVKNNLRTRFPNGVKVGREWIRIDPQSRREMTYSKYMQWLYNNDPQLYRDKLKATNHADEILEATTDWINDPLNHPRKDKIVDFAKGKVLMRIGNNDYEAKVLVGTEKDGKMKLYDVLDLSPTHFDAKSEMSVATTENPSPGAGRNTTLISDKSIPMFGEKVNGEIDIMPKLDDGQNSMGRSFNVLV